MTPTFNALPLPNIYQNIGMLALHYIRKQLPIKHVATPEHMRVKADAHNKYNASKHR